MNKDNLLYAYWDSLDEIWKNARPFLDRIYDQGVSLKPIERMKLHEYVYSYCTTFVHKASGRPQNSGQSFYEKITDYLKLRLNEIAAEMDTITTYKQLLIIYVQKWLPYQKASAELDLMCRYFNVNWVKKEQQEGYRHTVYSLAMNRWMELVFRRYDRMLVIAIKQKKYSEALVYHVLQSFVHLYATDVNQQKPVRDKLINIFEMESGVLQFYATQTEEWFKSILETKSYADFKPFLKYACLAMPDIEEGNKFKAILKSHIAQQLMDAIAKSMGGRDYVQAILGLRYGTLERGLRGHNKLLLVIDDVCDVAINSSEFNKKFPAAELLATYSHQLMTKKHTPEEEIKAELQRIVKVLEYLHDKDKFVIIYRFFLKKRQIKETSTSDDMETWMISQITKRFGNDLASGLDKQLKEMTASNVIKYGFESYLGGRNIKLGFDFRLVCFFEQNTTPNINLILPLEFQEVFKLFESFYVTERRKAKLSIEQSYGEIIININRKSPNIAQMSMFQMALLLQFNQNDKYTVAKLAENLGTQVDTIIPVLNSFIRSKILACGESLISSSTVEVVKEFTSRKRHLIINRANTEAKNKKIEQIDDKELRDRRSHLVQCAVVRIMKNNKQMSHGQLMSEVIGALQNQFKPDTKLVKYDIETLISKEIIERFDQNSYRYIS